MTPTCPPRRTLRLETASRARHRGQVYPRLEHKKSDRPCVLATGPTVSSSTTDRPIILQHALHGQVPRGARYLLEPCAGNSADRHATGHHLHLPDAPAGAAARARQLSDMRDGAQARVAVARRA